MSERANQLILEVLALPLEEREEVLSQLYEAEMAELPEGIHVPDEEEEHAELLRRLAMIEDGTAELVPFDDAMDRITEELSRRQKIRDAPQP